MSTSLKKIAAQSKTLIIAHRIFDNWRRRRAFKAGNTITAYGSTHESWSLEKSVSYINLVFREYLEHAGLGPEALRGKRILEVGPGDNFGVALKFLAAGAAKVVCLDKFYSERNVEQQTRIYHELRKQLSPDEARVFDECIELAGDIDLNEERLQYIYGHGIEEADQILEPGSFPTPATSKSMVADHADIAAAYDAVSPRPQPPRADLSNGSAKPPDPQEVADAVKQLIDLPPGQRPLRTVVGPVFTEGVAEYNEVYEQTKARLAEALRRPDQTITWTPRR